MSNNVFFISDLHFGHQKILEFAGQYREGDCPAEHDQILIEKWNSVVGKKDTVWVLGDVWFSDDAYGHMCLDELKGYKKLIAGNHDKNYKAYMRHFSQIRGMTRLSDYWLTHCPIHPSELRGVMNLHGHTHAGIITNAYGEPDERYINVCCEQTNGYPVNFEDIKNGTYKSRII